MTDADKKHTVLLFFFRREILADAIDSLSFHSVPREIVRLRAAPGKPRGMLVMHRIE
jgi:hypothetical protein